MVRYTNILPETQRNTRSPEARENLLLKNTKRKAEHFLLRAPTFKVDLDIDTLTTDMADLKLQQAICDNKLGENQPAQIFSGQWVDNNGTKIAFYLAERWLDSPVRSQASKH